MVETMQLKAVIPQRVAVQAAGEPYQPADHRPAEQAAHHGADGAGVGDGVFDMQTEIGPHNAEMEKVT